MKWPSEEKGTVIEMYHSAGDGTFICGVNGWITQEVMDGIVQDFRKYGEMLMGDGMYLFRASRCDDGGWELDRLDFKPMAECIAKREYEENSRNG